jgi:hypothetical protein
MGTPTAKGSSPASDPAALEKLMAAFGKKSGGTGAPELPPGFKMSEDEKSASKQIPLTGEDGKEKKYTVTVHFCPYTTRTPQDKAKLLEQYNPQQLIRLTEEALKLGLGKEYSSITMKYEKDKDNTEIKGQEIAKPHNIRIIDPKQLTTLLDSKDISHSDRIKYEKQLKSITLITHIMKTGEVFRREEQKVTITEDKKEKPVAKTEAKEAEAKKAAEAAEAKKAAQAVEEKKAAEAKKVAEAAEAKKGKTVAKTPKKNKHISSDSTTTTIPKALNEPDAPKALNEPGAKKKKPISSDSTTTATSSTSTTTTTESSAKKTDNTRSDSYLKNLDNQQDD